MRLPAAMACLLVAGCVQVGPEIEQRFLEVAVEGDDVRIVVKGASGLDWSELTARIVDCTDASMSSTAHLGNDPPYVNDLATSSGAPLYDRGGQEGVDCPNPTGARISKVPRPVRAGDFLQMCTTPNGMFAGLHDLKFGIFRGEDQVGHAFISAAVPTCRV